MKRKNKISVSDYIRANRKASRDEEISQFGHPLCHTRVHKSKKVYDRKKMKAGDRNLPFLFAYINVWDNKKGQIYSNCPFGVGVTGFEPVTSWSQTKHTNRTVLYPVKPTQK